MATSSHFAVPQKGATTKLVWKQGGGVDGPNSWVKVYNAITGDVICTVIDGRDSADDDMLANECVLGSLGSTPGALIYVSAEDSDSVSGANSAMFLDEFKFIYF